MSDEESQTSFLFPTFEVGVSLNGHIEEFQLSPAFYVHVVQEEEIDPFNFTELWIYISKHIHEYLFDFDITEATGPVDTDKLRLVSLSIHVHLSPPQLREVVDCEDCIENYNETISNRTTGTLSEDEDDEDE